MFDINQFITGLKIKYTDCRSLQANNINIKKSMNPNDRSKQCPRCRFILSKTHSDKIICKRCGYTSNKLQIVTEQDQFNANIRYNKRVSFKKQSQIDPVHEQNSHQTCLKNFQHLLKYLGTHFIKNNISKNIQERQKASQTFKKLWFAYLQKMSRQGNVISATFLSFAQKANKKKQKNAPSEDKSEEQNSSDQSESQKDLKEDPDQENKSVQQIKGKRGRKKIHVGVQNPQQQKKTKSQQFKDEALKEFKKIVNQTLKCFKTQKAKTPATLKQIISKQFLTKLISLNRSKIHQSSFSSLMYLAEKYSWVLVVSQIYQSKNKNSLQNKLHNKYVSQQDLKEICKQRNLHYEKRRMYTELTILSHDLLQTWYKESFKSSIDYMGWREPYPYIYLLETYRSEPNKPLIIEQIITCLQNMSQETVIKMQEKQKKVPQLSFKFICAIVYTTSLLTQQTFTILEVINHLLRALTEYVEDNKSSEIIERKEMMIMMTKEKNVKTRRVKKMAHQLFQYVEEFFGRQTLFTGKWCIKFCRMFKIPQKNSKQVQLLAETLVNGYIDQMDESVKVRIINGNDLVHNTSAHRYLLIQQPEIALSCLLIYLKLLFGLDRGRYPYLKCMGQISNLIHQSKQYLKEERDIRQIQYLLDLFENNPEQLNSNHEFGLIQFIAAVNKQFRPVYSQLQLKDVSAKGLTDIIRNVSQFRQMIQKKGQNHLSLMSNFNQFNSPQNQLTPIQVNFLSQQRQKEHIPELFHNLKHRKTLTITEQATKALDYLYENHTRHKQNQIQIQRVDSKHQHQDQALRNMIDLVGQQNQKQFRVCQNIDKPERHYEIIYHPTINILSHLKCNQLLVVAESLSLVLNGDFCDCKDILEWMGLLESVLKEFQT